MQRSHRGKAYRRKVLPKNVHLISRRSPVVSPALSVPVNSVPSIFPVTLYRLPDFSSTASNKRAWVFGLNDVLVKSALTGVMNLPVNLESLSCLSSTVMASGMPPFGVQLPDQVPLSSAGTLSTPSIFER